MSEVPRQVTTRPLAGVSVRCPLCDYDMRGLIECRCPECGFTSTWDELNDPKRARHPFLFEHHPQRSIRSAVKTFVGGLQPRRFWAGIYPLQPSRPGRLVLYGLICSSLVVALFLAISGVFLAIEIRHILAQITAGVSPFPPVVTRRYGSLGPAQITYPVPRFAPCAWNAATVASGPFVLIAFVLLPALWSWLTFLSLLVYQKSLRRSRLKPAHLLRVAIYSFDLVAWMGFLPLMVGLLSRMFILNNRLGTNGFVFDGMQIAAIGFPLWCLFISMGSYRLWLACRGYLHFNYALPAVVASQVVVFLAACCIVFIPDLYLDYIPHELYLIISRLMCS